ncbi:MAG: hypothetical protein H7A45_11700 [Verrucomicrobiales bacterium]|nr:hypothetical protein [Verrucomicrobiales bacterium]
MSNLAAMERRRGRGSRPIVRAFLLSLLFHATLFSVLEIGDRLDWWRSGPMATLARLLRLDAAARAAEARREELAAVSRELEQRAPLIFVDVDPSQAAPTSPLDTEFYGAVSSQAANPAPRDLDQPALDGTQEVVMKTADTERASASAPLQPSPPEPPPDLAALDDPAPDPGAEAPAEEVEPVAAEIDPSPETGDLAMVKPPSALTPLLSPGLPHAANRPSAPERPRTVAEALARRGLNPDSAMVGQKLRQEGGVKRFSVQSSLDVQASPLGDYDRQLVDAVQQCWFTLLREQRFSLDRLGKVVIEFRLSKEGRVSNMNVAESDVGDLYTAVCQLAIRKPSPYESWPPDVVRLVGGDYRDIRFTFYY